MRNAVVYESADGQRRGTSTDNSSRSEKIRQITVSTATSKFEGRDGRKNVVGIGKKQNQRHSSTHIIIIYTIALITASANGSRSVSVASCGTAGPSSANDAVVPLAVSLWPSTSLLFGTSVFATGGQPTGWEKRIERESGGLRYSRGGIKRRRHTGKRGSS